MPVEEHQQTKKEKTSVIACAGVPSVTTFFTSVKTSQLEYDLVVSEGVFANHTTQHNHVCSTVSNVLAPGASTLLSQVLVQVEMSVSVFLLVCFFLC